MTTITEKFNSCISYLSQRPVFLFVFFFMLSLLCNILAIKGEPVWDDYYYFFLKTEFHTFNPAYFWTTWQRWPIFKTVLNILYSLFEKNYFYYHLVNIIIHALNGFLLAYILKKIKFKYWILSAILFLIHPTCVQSSAWIFQIKNLLSVFFFFLSLLLLFYSIRKDFLIFPYLGSIVLYSASLLTKSIYIQAPVLIFFFLLGFAKLKWKKSLLFTLGHLIVASIYLPFFLGSNYNLQRSEIATRITKLQPSQRIQVDKNNTKTKKRELVELKKKQIAKYYNQFLLSGGKIIKKDIWDIVQERTLLSIKITTYYLTRIFYPIGLSGIYTLFSTDFNLLNSILFWCGCFAFFAIVMIVFYFVKTARINDPYFYFILSFGVLIAPYIGIIIAPYMMITHVSDHHLYGVIPFVIPCIVLIFANLGSRIRRNRIRQFLLNLVPLLLAFFISYSMFYSQFYSNSQRFYQRIIDFYPNQMIAYLNMADELLYYKRYKEAWDILIQGYNNYVLYNPEKIKNAKISKEIFEANIGDKIFFEHPILDPFFLMIVRNLEIMRK